MDCFPAFPVESRFNGRHPEHRQVECAECGMVVLNLTKHEEWHEKIAALVRGDDAS